MGRGAGAAPVVVGPRGPENVWDVDVSKGGTYCVADPAEGGKQAVAEAWRNIVATGGKPLADRRMSRLLK